MGVYVNPGNEGFSLIRAGEYVDKTGLIALVNTSLGTTRRFVCVSRPRRFGKSFAAESLVAYYCCGCDSHGLFEGLAVASSPDYERHLNAYNVIHLDMTAFVGASGADIVPAVESALVRELREQWPLLPEDASLTESILGSVRASGLKFVFVIDEWDAVFREDKANASAQESYVRLLRLLFKNANFTPHAVAAAYLTGILPIKRYGTQSALTDFREFTMVRPGAYAPYVGFTANEVATLASRHGLDLEELRRWYDGYDLPGAGEVYAPYSVMQACENGVVDSYWTSSETYESLRTYIEMNFQDLQDDIVRMIGGESLPVDPGTFQNDLTSIRSRDDVLTLLVHLGYLVYEEGSRTVRIPNEEVRREFVRSVAASAHPRLVEAVRESDALLQSLIAGDEAAVAAGIQRVHDRETTPLFYNDEQSLRSVVKMALLSAIDEYARVEELPSDHGVAEVAYVPRSGSRLPALLVELKWNKPAQTALAQAHQRDYPQVLRDLGTPLVLAGITYDARTKRHDCTIERLDAQDNPLE